MNDKLPSLLFCIGIPGSGKTSWLEQFLKTSPEQWTILSHDEMKKKILNDVNNQRLNRELALIIKQRAKDLLLQNVNVIIDQTNVKTKYRKEFLEDLPSCRLFAKLFDVDPELAISRIKSDISKGRDRANVPDEEVYAMYGRYLHTKKVITSEGFEII